MIERVCLVGPVHPYRGGIAHHTSMLAREFGGGHDVKVINFKRLYPSFLFPGKTQLDESGEPLTARSVRSIDTLNPLSFIVTARAIRRYRPDLIIFQWWHPFFAIAYASILFMIRRTPCTVIFLCHNVLPHESSPVDRMLFRIAFHRVRRFLVHSQEDRRNLLAMKPDAIVAVHPLPLFDAFPRGRFSRDDARKALGLSGKVLLFFGLVRAYKGLGTLLEAFALCQQSLDATLLIVGEFYESKDKYTNLIRKLGISTRVMIVDSYVPNEEVEKYFQACDLVVLPYRSATQSAIVQMAFGFDKPVVVTAVGGLPDVVDDGVTGFVVPPDDPAALSRAMVRFYEEERGESMSRAVVEGKERFSWARAGQALLQLAGRPDGRG